MRARRSSGRSPTGSTRPISRSALAGAINDRGAVPLISWEPWDWDGGTEQPAYALRRILAGDHDALIDRWAIEIAAYRRPVMLRFAPEMNGDWRPWSIGRQRQPGRRVRRHLALRPQALRARGSQERHLGLEPDHRLRRRDPAPRGLPRGRRGRLAGGRRLQLGLRPRLGLAVLRRHLRPDGERAPQARAAPAAHDRGDRQRTGPAQGELGHRHVDLGTRRRRRRRGLVRVLQRDRLAPVRKPSGREGRPHRRATPNVAPRRGPRGHRASCEPPAIVRMSGRSRARTADLLLVRQAL